MYTEPMCIGSALLRQLSWPTRLWPGRLILLSDYWKCLSSRNNLLRSHCKSNECCRTLLLIRRNLLRSQRSWSGLLPHRLHGLFRGARSCAVVLLKRKELRHNIWTVYLAGGVYKLKIPTIRPLRLAIRLFLTNRLLGLLTSLIFLKVDTDRPFELATGVNLFHRPGIDKLGRCARVVEATEEAGAGEAV